MLPLEGELVLHVLVVRHAASREKTALREIERSRKQRQRAGVDAEAHVRRARHLEGVAEQAETRDVGARAHAEIVHPLGGLAVERRHAAVEELLAARARGRRS